MNENFKKIPHNASTHYAYSIYPSKPVSQQTQAGFVPKPNLQRKTSKESKIIFRTDIKIEQAGTANPKLERNTLRNDIDKAAIAEFFRSTAMSYEEQKQENLEALVAELESADAAKAPATDNVSAKELHDFVVACLVRRAIEARRRHTVKHSEFNENVTEKFLNKYRGSDTSKAMRAFDKKKRHSTKLAYWMHELGLTK